MTYNINPFHIASADKTSIFETQFDIGPYDQIYYIKINGPDDRPTIFILLQINKAILKIIPSIYFNRKLLPLGPAKLEL